MNGQEATGTPMYTDWLADETEDPMFYTVQDEILFELPAVQDNIRINMQNMMRHMKVRN